MSFGTLLLSKLIDDADYDSWVRFQLVEELFRGDEEIELFDYVHKHALKYGSLPKRDTTEKETGIVLLETIEPAQYYLDHVEKRLKHNNTRDLITEIDGLLKDKEIDKAIELLLDGAVNIRAVLDRSELIDFKKNPWDVIKQEYASQISDTTKKLTFGWPTFDEMSGGLKGSDVAVFVGRPAMGKTFKLLRVALHMWEMGRTPLFVSMEMEPVELVQRLSAMYSHIPLKPLMQAKLSDTHIKKLAGALKAIPDSARHFWIVDGDMASSVDDLVMLCHQLKPDVLFVDGAYLLDYPDERANTWVKVKGNVEAIKRKVGKRLWVPSVLSYQFNREVKKLKKDEQAGLEHIGLGDAVGQIASLVLGLFEEESAATLQRRTIRVLKGRRGEVGEFSVNWNFDNMDFSEYVEPTAEEINLDAGLPDKEETPPEHPDEDDGL